MSTQTFRPDAVFFDLDGTVADTLVDIAVALDAARAEHGLEPVADPPRVRTWIGHGARKLIARSLGTEDVDAEGVAEIMVTFRRVYRGISGRHSDLYPGMREFLADLRARGVKTALTTNKPREATDEFLSQCGVTELFDAVATPDDVGGLTKPSPAMLFLAARLVDVAPARCLLIGDGDADIGGARAAGMPVIAVLGGFGDPDALRLLSADAYVERATDARPLLDAEARG